MASQLIKKTKGVRLRHKQESALLVKLQDVHGFGISELSREADRIGMMFKVGADRKPVLTGVRFVRLAVPAGSALWEALSAKPKAKKAAKR